MNENTLSDGLIMFTEDILFRLTKLLLASIILHIAEDPIPSKTSISSSVFNLKTLTI